MHNARLVGGALLTGARCVGNGRRIFPQLLGAEPKVRDLDGWFDDLIARPATGVGGLIMQFRLGPMTYEQTASSLTLFKDKVIPAL